MKATRVSLKATHLCRSDVHVRVEATRVSVKTTNICRPDLRVHVEGDAGMFYCFSSAASREKRHSILGGAVLEAREDIGMARLWGG